MIPCASPVVAELGKSEGDPCLFRAGVRGVVFLASAKVEDRAERVHGGVRPACRFVAEQAVGAGFHIVQADRRGNCQWDLAEISRAEAEQITAELAYRHWPADAARLPWVLSAYPG